MYDIKKNRKISGLKEAKITYYTLVLNSRIVCLPIECVRIVLKKA